MTHLQVVAAKSFKVGDRVEYKTNPALVGVVVGHNLDAEIPQVKVTWNVTSESVQEYEPIELTRISLDAANTSNVETELTPLEVAERANLESKIEQAFYVAGTALREIRDRRLYRDKFKTFEEYCQKRFSFTRHTANLKILAADVVDDLVTNGHQILPINERQIRPMGKLSPQKRSQVWDTAVNDSRGKPPTGSTVKSIVERLKEKPLNLASDYCQVGQIFKLQRLAAPDSKYNHCWAVAIEVENRVTVKCQVYDSILDIKQENIKIVDMTPAESQIKLQMIERVSQLARHDLDPAAWALLQFLNHQDNYTPTQLKLLETVEEIYIKPSSHDTKN